MRKSTPLCSASIEPPPSHSRLGPRYAHTTLSKALTQAVDWDLVPRNAASRVKLPKQTR